MRHRFLTALLSLTLPFLCLNQSQAQTSSITYSPELKAKAEVGDARAQTDLGTCYFYGNGVTKNLETAARWCREAADQGDAVGQRKLGLCYEYGYGVKKDMTKAVELYRKAAAQGDADGKRLLAKYESKGGVTDGRTKVSASEADPVTPRATQKQDFRPSPLPADLEAEADNVFRQGMSYFIWPDKNGALESKGSGTILEIGLRFAVNPQMKVQSFMTRIKLTAKDSQGRGLEISNHATGAAVSEAKKADTSVVYANVFLLSVSLKGHGAGTIDLILAGAEDPAKAKQISNRITVPLVFN